MQISIGTSTMMMTLTMMVAMFSVSRRALFVRSFPATALGSSRSASIRLSTSRDKTLPPVGLFALRSKMATALSHPTFSTNAIHTKLSSLTTDEAETKRSSNEKLVPITLLAGFLGSGKTTTLRSLLADNDGIKIGVIVNDVASVNIDQKLISSTPLQAGDESLSSSSSPVIGGDDTVELQNGCACCSLSDELLTSVERLTGGGTRDLDAIVVELSGVADPVQVRENWMAAVRDGHPATRLAEFRNVVTLVDSSTFGTDWMSWDTSGEREGWDAPDDDCAFTKKVPELLAEQVEAANVLVINKIDLAGKVQTQTATGVARKLNEKAKVFEVEFGKISAEQILVDSDMSTSSHDHDHDHASSDCNEPGCTDTSHDHSHEHASSSECADPGCTDTSHSHSHEHASSSDCTDPGCTDTSHSHSHDHGSECSDPGCTDTSHSHSHDHASTSTENLGISNFVYKSDRPFHAIRLMALLNFWPIPIKDTLDLEQLTRAAKEGYVDGEDETNRIESPFAGVLRSKGFCWLAPTRWEGAAADVWRHDTAMYWSHAGKHFGISTAGRWWGTISQEQMKNYFASNMKEYERILREDFASEEWGDRRQELVFIGAGIDEENIREALDKCLVTDEELDSYREQVINLMEIEAP